MRLRDNIRPPGRYREGNDENLPSNPIFVHPTVSYNTNRKPPVWPTLEWNETLEDRESKERDRDKKKEGSEERPARVYKDRKIVPAMELNEDIMQTLNGRWLSTLGDPGDFDPYAMGMSDSEDEIEHRWKLPVFANTKYWSDLSDGMRLIIIRELTDYMDFDDAISFLQLEDQEFDEFIALCADELRIREEAQKRDAAIQERQMRWLDSIDRDEGDFGRIFDDEGPKSDTKMSAMWKFTKAEVSVAKNFLGNYRFREEFEGVPGLDIEEIDKVPTFEILSAIQNKLSSYIGVETNYEAMDLGIDVDAYLPEKRPLQEEVERQMKENQDEIIRSPAQDVSGSANRFPTSLSKIKEAPVKKAKKMSPNKDIEKDGFENNLLPKRGRPRKSDKIAHGPSGLRQVINADDIESADNSPRDNVADAIKMTTDTALHAAPRRIQNLARSPFKAFSSGSPPTKHSASFRDDLSARPASASLSKISPCPGDLGAMVESALGSRLNSNVEHTMRVPGQDASGVKRVQTPNKPTARPPRMFGDGPIAQSTSSRADQILPGACATQAASSFQNAQRAQIDPAIWANPSIQLRFNDKPRQHGGSFAKPKPSMPTNEFSIARPDQSNGNIAKSKQSMRSGSSSIPNPAQHSSTSAVPKTTTSPRLASITDQCQQVGSSTQPVGSMPVESLPSATSMQKNDNLGVAKLYRPTGFSSSRNFVAKSLTQSTIKSEENQSSVSLHTDSPMPISGPDLVPAAYQFPDNGGSLQAQLSIPTAKSPTAMATDAPILMDRLAQSSTPTSNPATTSAGSKPISQLLTSEYVQKLPNCAIASVPNSGARITVLSPAAQSNSAQTRTMLNCAPAEARTQYNSSGVIQGKRVNTEGSATLGSPAKKSRLEPQQDETLRNLRGSITDNSRPIGFYLTDTTIQLPQNTAQSSPSDKETVDDLACPRTASRDLSFNCYSPSTSRQSSPNKSRPGSPSKSRLASIIKLATSREALDNAPAMVVDSATFQTPTKNAQIPPNVSVLGNDAMEPHTPLLTVQSGSSIIGRVNESDEHQTPTSHSDSILNPPKRPRKQSQSFLKVAAAKVAGQVLLDDVDQEILAIDESKKLGAPPPIIDERSRSAAKHARIASQSNTDTTCRQSRSTQLVNASNDLRIPDPSDTPVEVQIPRQKRAASQLPAGSFEQDGALAKKAKSNRSSLDTSEQLKDLDTSTLPNAQPAMQVNSDARKYPAQQKIPKSSARRPTPKAPTTLQVHSSKVAGSHVESSVRNALTSAENEISQVITPKLDAVPPCMDNEYAARSTTSTGAFLAHGKSPWTIARKTAGQSQTPPSLNEPVLDERVLRYDDPRWDDEVVAESAAESPVLRKGRKQKSPVAKEAAKPEMPDVAAPPRSSKGWKSTPAKTEASKTAASKPSASKAMPANTKVLKAAAPKTSTPKVSSPKASAPRATALQTKTITPQTVASKAVVPKAEAKKSQK